MKNKKIKRQVPSYAFGLDQIFNVGQLLGNGIQATQSSDTSKGNIAGSTISGAATGAVAGASIGGPIGAAVGGLAGGLTNLFTGRKRRRQAQEAQTRLEQGQQIAQGQAATAALQQQYYMNDDNQLAYTFANGGIMPNDLAYVDNNEIIRDVNGNITQVPDTTYGTDQHLIDATGLESVLSDTLKREGSNETFAQAGEAIKKIAKPSKRTDRFAEASNELNSNYANQLYDALLDEQTMIQNKKGIKPQYKSIPSYATGRDGRGKAYFPQDLLNIGAGLGNTYSPISVGAYNTPTQTNTSVTNTPVTNSTNNIARTIVPDRYNQVLATPSYQGLTQPTLATWDPNTLTSDYSTSLDDGFGDTDKSNGYKFDLNNSLGSLASLSGVAANYIQSNRSVDVEPTRTNPYAGAATRALAGRRYNVQPAREANRRARNIASYNASRVNPNTGANLALRSQFVASELAANSELESIRQNYNNQYAADYASTLLGLGNQQIASAERASEINAGNQAAARNLRRQAATDFSKWAQTQQQMNNQRSRDEIIYPFLQDYLSQGYGDMTIQQLNNQFYSRR